MDIIEDKLNRQDFICFVEDLIINSDQYKRNTENKAYVMALDSPWGTGKTHFIKLLNQEIEKKENMIVVNYNAWENDYCENPFNPLIYDILHTEKVFTNFKNDIDKENAEKLLLSVMKVGMAIGKQVVSDVVEKKTGFNLEKAISNANKAQKDIKNFLLC